MRTEKEAIEAARRQARRYGEDCFVVLSRDENDEPGNDYHVAMIEDVETYFAGCPVLFATED